MASAPYGLFQNVSVVDKPILRPGGPIHPLPVVKTTGRRVSRPIPRPGGPTHRKGSVLARHARCGSALIGFSRACVGPAGLMVCGRPFPGLGSPGKGSVGPPGLALRGV